MSSADFFKINLFEKFFLEYNHSDKQFGYRSAKHFVGPDLVANCFQKLTAEDTSRQRVKINNVERLLLTEKLGPG